MELAINEAERLAAWVNEGILDTDFEDCFDRIVRIAVTALHVPIALVTLVDQKRLWFKAAVGVSLRQIPRETSFCTHTILGKDVMVVSDATKDCRFIANPMVTGEPGIKFYAGAPLLTSEGYALGTICVIDRTPRSGMPPDQQQLLRDLADTVMDMMEARRAHRAASLQRSSH